MIATDPLAPYRANLKHVDGAALKECTGRVDIVETDPGGSGTISFNVTDPCLRFRPGNVPIDWLTNKRCSDGAILEFKNGRIRVHVIELKSKMSVDEWNKTKKQFEGMVLNTMALQGILELPAFERVTFYTFFKSDNLSPAGTASPVTIKTPVGGKTPYSRAADWHGGWVDILGYANAKLVKQVRDGSGNAAASLV